jgi:hypothetical protein
MNQRRLVTEMETPFFYFTSCITLCKFPIESIKCNKAFLTKSRAKTVVVEEKNTISIKM